ncbi:helix-turn-helix domain-containing protein [Kineococcus auxinigenes]|uniref:helix-turn-helix domain-containing protein n=1 Tax=unclassified Kineococcus TaxID=2621656 RepID=UPI003D7C56C0
MVEGENLGTALRRWRDRLSPLDVGLPARARRRAAGLRREELADLAGLSVDYVVRLEQGRAVNPSAQVVATLARALQLSPAERDHAHRLAGLLPPADGVVSHLVPAGVQRMLARLVDLPVGVFAADWTLLTWTPSWAALIGDPGDLPLEQRNLVRAVFGGEDGGLASWPVRHADVGMPAALVSDLREALARYPRDEGLVALTEEVSRTSPEFRRLCREGTVGRHVSARKTIEHPVVGDVTCDCDVLTAPGSDVRLVLYSAAAGSPDAEKLEFLRVTGGRPAAAPAAAPPATP